MFLMEVKIVPRKLVKIPPIFFGVLDDRKILYGAREGKGTQNYAEKLYFKFYQDSISGSLPWLQWCWYPCL